MSLYSERVAQDSPLFYFENNSTGVNNTGSITPTIVTGSSTAFTSTGGIQNGPYMVNAARTGAYGFEYSNSTTIFNDRVFSITGWFKVASTDISTNPDWIFHPGILAQGVFLQKTDKLYLGSIFNNVQVATSTAPSFDTWHHFAVTMDTTNLKLYLDGTLIQTATSPASVSIDSEVKYWTRATTTGTTRNGVQGSFDEFAVFNTTLSSTTISEHYNAGFGVDFHATVLTASALAVNPIVTAIRNINIAADPATASATFPEALQNDIDLPILLETYMQSLATSGKLEQWWKFDQYKVVTNYGTGGNSGIAFLGNSYSENQNGIQGSGTIRFTGSLNDGAIIAQNPLGCPAYNPELSDGNYVMGMWFKAPAGMVDTRTIFATSDASGRYINLNFLGGISKFNYIVNSSGGNHTIQSTSTINPQNWNFIAAKFSGTTMELFVNGVSQGTQTVNGTLPGTINNGGFGTNNISAYGGTPLFVSQFFIGNTTNITNTDLTNIYNAGANQLQASAEMPMPVFKDDNSFNTYVLGLDPYFYYKLDETSGAPQSITQPMNLLVENSNFTQNITTKNKKGIRLTNRDTVFGNLWTAPAGTFSTNNRQSFAVYAKPVANGQINQIASTGAGNSNGSGIGLSFIVNASNFTLLRVFSSTGADTITNTNTNVTDGNYHLFVGVKDGSTLKLYIDGKLTNTVSSPLTLTDNGQFLLGGNGVTPLANVARDVTIDEVAMFASALTDAQVFEMYRSLTETMDTTAQASLPMPAYQAGFGPTVAVDVMTASAKFENVFKFTSPAEASSLFQMPNFLAQKVVSVVADTMTASAQAENPGFDIGENNLVLHMDADAMMGDARVLIPGKWNASPAIANPALMVQPAIVTTLGALIRPESFNANAFLPVPPAYITLADDPWFVRLLQGHSDRKSEFIQGTLSSVPNQSSTDIIKGGFLSFFDDVLNPITQTTNPNTIASEIPNYYFTTIEDQKFDTNGNLIPLDTSKAVARVTPSRGVLTPSPIVAPGYFDDQQRKAVRISNIEIPLPGTSTNFSIRPYNLEFSFKATKQNQVLAYGQFTSPSSTNSRKVGAVGLYNGKIYLAEDFYTPVSAFGETGLRSLRVAGSVPHPINFTQETYVGYMLGNKNVADGQWHHIVIQRGYTDNRTQIWIDGVLDKQLGVQSNDGRSSGYANIPGSDASQEVRPYIIGFNSADTNLSSDFETSAWNFYPGRFLEEREISLNSLAFIQADPIKPEPMLATAASTPNTKAAGNKARALLLYWWPVTRQFGPTESLVSNDNGQFGPSDTSTFDKSIYTNDYDNQIPQDYYGWDIFPVSITGYAGDLGGSRSPFIKENVLQSGGYYIDPITSAPRYLDVLNDIDLSAFDAIFFRNYPDQSEELDAYVREQFSDEYFNLKEKDLYNDFIASLRAATDTGISLFITNAQLAIDLGIIEGYEEVPDLSSGIGDEYAPTVVPGGDGLDESQGLFIDVHRNNRLRVVNTVPGLTNEPGYIWQDWAYFRGGVGQNVDPFSGAPNRPFISLANKPNGLQVGDTFVISDASYLDTYYEAVPFNKVKAGKVITAFANTYVNGTTVTDNPYKNFATTIALEPGTILNGKATVGKIFVNFTERLDRTTGAVSSISSSMRPTDGARDNLIVDLIQDEWINAAYDNGEISLAVRDAYLAASFNLDRRLEAEIAGLNRPAVIASIQNEKYWDSNGNLILTQKSAIEDPTGAIYAEDPNVPGFGKGQRRTRINKVRKDGTPTTGSVTSSLQWFSFTYSYQYLRAAIQVPSMLTRGFRWLSNKVVDEGTVIRTEKATAIASMPNHLGVGNKDKTVNAQSMLSLATIVHAPTYTLSDVLINTLPLTAIGTFGQFAKNIAPDALLASALAKQPRIVSIQEDEVVLYINHVDPILYLREDVIK